MKRRNFLAVAVGTLTGLLFPAPKVWPTRRPLPKWDNVKDDPRYKYKVLTYRGKELKVACGAITFTLPQNQPGVVFRFVALEPDQDIIVRT
jgi:hypothetical protein